jgi:hypothetical protein
MKTETPAQKSTVNNRHAQTVYIEIKMILFPVSSLIELQIVKLQCKVVTEHGMLI